MFLILIMQKIFLVTFIFSQKKKKTQQRPFGIIGSLTAEALQFLLKKKKKHLKFVYFYVEK